MKRLITICIIAGLTVFATPMACASLMDNFDDNSTDTSLWSPYQDNSNVSLDEDNQRLELHSTDNGSGSAGYLANGWGFLPTDDFSFKVDFHFDPKSSPDDDAAVELYLIKDEYNDLGIEAGINVDDEKVEPLFYYDATIGGNAEPDINKARTANDGTLFISYDATNDNLYLSDKGYWAGDDAWITVPGLLQGPWGGGVVYPSLSGWSEGMLLKSGDAYLDDFIVDSGTIVPAPGAFLLCSMGLGLASWLSMRRSP